MPTLQNFNTALAPEVLQARIITTRDGAAAERRTAHQRNRKANPKKATKGETTRARARVAAEWLARHWPKDVAVQGGPAFIRARTREILNGSYPARYWYKCEQLAHSTAVSEPGFATAATQPQPPYYEPLALNTNALYKKTARRYPTPSFGTGLPNPAPGWAGSVVAGAWRDEWMAQAEIDYHLPQPFDANDPQPLFAKSTILWHVVGSGHGNKIWFGSQIQATLWQQDEPSPRDETALAGQARYYVYTYPLPSDAPPGYDRSMQRTFQHDALLRPSPRLHTFEDCDRCTLRIAPCPPMGKYRYGNMTAAADLNIEADLYQAKQQDPDQGAAPSVFEGFWSVHLSGKSETDPLFPDLRIYVWLANDLSGAPWPLTELHKLPIILQSAATSRRLSFGAPITLAQPKHIFAHGRAYKLEASPGDFERALAETEHAMTIINNDLYWLHYWLDCNGWKTRPGRMTQEKFNTRWVAPLPCHADPPEEEHQDKPARSKPKTPLQKIRKPTRLISPLKARRRAAKTTSPLSSENASGSMKNLIRYSTRAATTRAAPPQLPSRRATITRAPRAAALNHHSRRYPDSPASATHTIQQYNQAASKQPAPGYGQLSFNHAALDLNSDLRAGAPHAGIITRVPISLRSI